MKIVIISCKRKKVKIRGNRNYKDTLNMSMALLIEAIDGISVKENISKEDAMKIVSEVLQEDIFKHITE